MTQQKRFYVKDIQKNVYYNIPSPLLEKSIKDLCKLLDGTNLRLVYQYVSPEKINQTNDRYTVDDLMEDLLIPRKCYEDILNFDYMKVIANRINNYRKIGINAIPDFISDFETSKEWVKETNKSVYILEQIENIVIWAIK